MHEICNFLYFLKAASQSSKQRCLCRVEVKRIFTWSTYQRDISTVAYFNKCQQVSQYYIVPLLGAGCVSQPPINEHDDDDVAGHILSFSRTRYYLCLLATQKGPQPVA